RISTTSSAPMPARIPRGYRSWTCTASCVRTDGSLRPCAAWPPATPTARTCHRGAPRWYGSGWRGGSGPRACSGADGALPGPVEGAVVDSGGREVDARDRPAAGRRTERDAAPVAVDDPAHDREAEPRPRHRARGGGAVEAVENAREVLGVDAGTVVAHRDRRSEERRVGEEGR